VCARATRSFDARGIARADGARSTAAWLRVVGRIEAGRAGRQVRHARALATLPATEAALAAGRVNSDVVTRITAADNDRQRTFRGALRRAILARDGGCTDPLCDEPAWRCQVDHRIPASDGGPTCACNGDTRCAHHNRTKAATDSRAPGQRHHRHAPGCPHRSTHTHDPPTSRGP
jgi:hypothetical protein